MVTSHIKAATPTPNTRVHYIPSTTPLVTHTLRTPYQGLEDGSTRRMRDDQPTNPGLEEERRSEGENRGESHDQRSKRPTDSYVGDLPEGMNRFPTEFPLRKDKRQFYQQQTRRC